MCPLSFKTTQNGPLCLFSQDLPVFTFFVPFYSNITPMPSMSRMRPVLVVGALLMLLLLWFYY